MATANTEEKTSIEALRSDLKKVQEDIATLSQHLRGAADETADTMRRRVRDVSQQAKESARERIQQGRTSLENELQDRPLTVIGIVFAAGVLIGRFMSR